MSHKPQGVRPSSATLPGSPAGSWIGNGLERPPDGMLMLWVAAQSTVPQCWANVKDFYECLPLLYNGCVQLLVKKPSIQSSFSSLVSSS